MLDKIRQWAIDRNLQNVEDTKQLAKLMEEVGELSSAIIKNDEEKIIDSLGDSVVVLTILAQIRGYNLEDCIEAAYTEIKDRKGKMINGIFVKEEDIKQ